MLPLLCPARGGEMKIIAFLTDPSDPSPGFDPAEPEPMPEFEFDQSVPGDFDFGA